MDFANALSALMTQRGITAYRVAKLCGVTQTTVGNWLSGKTRPYNKDRAGIAAALGVGEAQLFGGDEKPTPGVEDGLTQDQRELIDLLPQLSPQMIAVLLATAKALLQSQDNL